jgi:glucoamylase
VSTSQAADHASAGRLDVRPPASSLATALLGNGALLVPLDAWGEPLALHWPNPGRTLDGASLRLLLPGEVRAEAVQHGALTSDIVTTVRALQAGAAQQGDESASRLVMRQLVHPLDDALVIELSLLASVSDPLHCTVELTGAAADHGVLAIAWDATHVASIGAGSTRAVDIEVSEPMPVTLVVAVARDASDACEVAQRLAAAGFSTARAAREEHELAAVAQRTPTLVTGELDRLDLAGGRILRALRDRDSGAVIAAPECDPERVRSGGYGFVWVRDLAFIAIAAAVAGDRELALGVLRWLPRAQSSDGLFEQRHHTDGRVAPGWGLQLDETGAALHAIAEVTRVLDASDVVDELWPCVCAAADALVELLHPSTGLPAASMDPWEERLGVHTFTAAATAAGLAAAATLAATRDHAAAVRWASGAQRVRAGIDRWLWSEEHGRFLRARDVARVDAHGEPVPAGYLPADRRPDAAAVSGRPVHEVASVDAVDATIDASLLGLTYPFGVVDHGDARMGATIDAVAAALRTECGALLRYPGDTYLGGNPWVLTTLWLGLARRAPGARVVAGGLDTALAAASAAMLLPEQVDARTNRPVWVSPLAWSHAFALLASRADHRLPSA